MTIHIDVVSDVVCPWCYIGKKRLEQALARCPELDVAIHWRTYQLDATIPDAGYDRQTYIANKFGGAEQAQTFYAKLKETGKSEQLDLDFDAIKVSPNTRNAHRLIHWAGEAGKQDAIVDALFAAYFEEGRNIGATDVLIDIASAHGLDGEAIAEKLASEADVRTVELERSLAGELNVTGVPFFVINSRYAIPGAAAPEHLAEALQQAANDTDQSESERTNLYDQLKAI